MNQLNSPHIEQDIEVKSRSIISTTYRVHCTQKQIVKIKFGIIIVLNEDSYDCQHNF